VAVDRRIEPILELLARRVDAGPDGVDGHPLYSGDFLTAVALHLEEYEGRRPPSLNLFLEYLRLTEDEFNLMLDLTSALSLIPFLLAASYALRLGGRSRDVTVAVQRSSAYLNWRLGSKPFGDYRTLGLYEEDELLAFVTYCLKGKHGGRIGYVMELLHVPEASRAATHLLRLATRDVADRGGDAILAWNLPHSPTHNRQECLFHHNRQECLFHQVILVLPESEWVRMGER
jgi:hypothetical protein